MRWFLFLLAAASLASSVLAADGKGALTVVMTGFRNDAGTAMVSVFGGSEGFPYETSRAVAKAGVAIENGRAVAVFPGLAYGTYAVAVFHDENGSGRLERNALGIPRQGYGLSNAPSGLPRFDKSAFSLEAPETTVRIPLKY